MSSKTSIATPDTEFKSAPSPMQSTISAEHDIRPQAATPSVATGPATELQAGGHALSGAGPAAQMGSPYTCETKGVEPGTSHSRTAHKEGGVLQSLVKELESADASKRVAAAVAMGKLADCAATAPLIGALRDADADVASEAAASLGALGDASAVEPLIAVLENADGYFHPVVRAAATFSLGQLHDLRAFEPLVLAINDPVAEASAEAIRSLATLSDRRGVDALLAVIRNAHGFFTSTPRRAAILGLAKLGGEQAECELHFVANNQWEDAVIREAAIEATSASLPAMSDHRSGTH